MTETEALKRSALHDADDISGRIHAGGYRANLSDVECLRNHVRKLVAALSRAPEDQELGSSTRMTSPASRSQTPLSDGEVAPGVSREAAIRSSERLSSFVSSTISKAQAAAGDTEGGAGWLVEGWNARTGEFKACWWGLGDAFEERFGWTTDSTKALRFARETDAQEYIVEAGWTDAKPTEHVWGSVRPSPADYLGKVIESAISESLSGDWEAARDAAVTLILSKLKENGLSREELGGLARSQPGSDAQERSPVPPLSDGGQV